MQPPRKRSCPAERRAKPLQPNQHRRAPRLPHGGPRARECYRRTDIRITRSRSAAAALSVAADHEPPEPEPEETQQPVGAMRTPRSRNRSIARKTSAADAAGLLASPRPARATTKGRKRKCATADAGAPDAAPSSVPGSVDEPDDAAMAPPAVAPGAMRTPRSRRRSAARKATAADAAGLSSPRPSRSRTVTRGRKDNNRAAAPAQSIDVDPVGAAPAQPVSEVPVAVAPAAPIEDAAAAEALRQARNFAQRRYFSEVNRVADRVRRGAEAAYQVNNQRVDAVRAALSEMGQGTGMPNMRLELALEQARQQEAQWIPPFEPVPRNWVRRYLRSKELRLSERMSENLPSPPPSPPEARVERLFAAGGAQPPIMRTRTPTPPPPRGAPDNVRFDWMLQRDRNRYQ